MTYIAIGLILELLAVELKQSFYFGFGIMKYISTTALVLLSFLPITATASLKPLQSVPIDPVVLIFFEKAYQRSLLDKAKEGRSAEISFKELEIFFEEAYWAKRKD